MPFENDEFPAVAEELAGVTVDLTWRNFGSRQQSPGSTILRAYPGGNDILMFRHYNTAFTLKKNDMLKMIS